MKFAVSIMLLAIVAGFAQTRNQTPAPVFKSRADLVVVPVIVRNKHGEHVPGLAVNDFSLEDNGVAEKVSSVEEITSDTTPPEPVVPTEGVFTNQFVNPQQPKELVIIALDLVNTPAMDMQAAREAVLKFLATKIKQDQVVGLVTIDPGRVRLLHAFTSSARVLSEALQRATGVSAAPAAPDAVGSGQPLSSAQETRVRTTASGLSAMIAEARQTIQQAEARTVTARQDQGMKSTLESLRILSSWVAGIPGRKVLVWVTGSVPFINQSDTTSLRAGDYYRAMKALSDANVSVYPVDARGLFNLDFQAQSDVYMGSGPYIAAPVPGSIRSVPGPQDPVYGHFAMNEFAKATGGLALYNRNDIEKMLETAASDSARYYMLSYYLRKHTAGWHKLKVSVKRSGVTTRARSGFYVTKQEPEAEAVRQAEENTAVLSPFEYTALPLTLKWSSTMSAEGKRKVHFEVAIPPSAGLVDDTERNVLDLDFMTMATAASGEAAGLTSRNVHSALKPAAVQQIEGSGVTYVSNLELKPGEYAVRVVVRDNCTGRVGSVTAPLRVQ